MKVSVAEASEHFCAGRRAREDQAYSSEIPLRERCLSCGRCGRGGRGRGCGASSTGHESLSWRTPERQAAGPNGGRRTSPCSHLEQIQARRDTQLFLAAPQTLGRPVKLHLIDAFLRLRLYGRAGAVQPNSGSNKRDQCVSTGTDTQQDSANRKMNSDSVTFRMKKGASCGRKLEKTHAGLGKLHTQRPWLQSHAINTQIKGVNGNVPLAGQHSPQCEGGWPSVTGNGN